MNCEKYIKKRYVIYMTLNMCIHNDFEYIYTKKYKDDCTECDNSNIVDSIYCQCEKSNENTISIIRHMKPFKFERCNVLKLQETHYSLRLSS